MKCKYFCRVEDEGSQARFRTGRGVLASDMRSRVDFQLSRNMCPLRRHFCNHMNWSNRRKTPFISAYCCFKAAYEEALRRVRRGKKNVIIIFIDPSRADYRVEYRNARWLAEDLECWIPTKAWNNSEFEYLFLRCIPARAIVNIIRL